MLLDESNVNVGLLALVVGCLCACGCVCVVLQVVLVLVLGEYGCVCDCDCEWGRWVAKAGSDYLGSYPTPEDAAVVYDQHASSAKSSHKPQLNWALSEITELDWNAQKVSKWGLTDDARDLHVALLLVVCLLTGC